MTGSITDSDRSSQGSSASSYPYEIGRSIKASGNNALQQRNSPRAQRFTQKLVKAARKSPLARFPLATPTASVSLSPSLEPYLDDDMIADNNSCFSSSSSSSYCNSPQQRDDQEINRHLQDLILSPQRPTTTDTTCSNLSATIGDSWRDKRPQVHQRGSDSPSLSVKPKRRKLKQQRTTAWRILDTTVVQHETSDHMEQHTCRRSSRIAGKKQKAIVDVSDKKVKNPPVILGVPSGVKSSQVTEGDSIHGYDNDGNKQQQQHRSQRRRPRVDIVEERLDKLMGLHDSLDLSHHSVVPKNHKAAPAPIVIVLDEDEDDLCDKVKLELDDNYQHRSSPSPSSSLTAMAPAMTPPRSQSPSQQRICSSSSSSTRTEKVQTIDIIDEDEEMTSIDANTKLPSVDSTSSTDTTQQQHHSPSTLYTTGDDDGSRLDQVDSPVTPVGIPLVTKQPPPPSAFATHTLSPMPKEAQSSVKSTLPSPHSVTPTSNIPTKLTTNKTDLNTPASPSSTPCTYSSPTVSTSIHIDESTTTTTKEISSDDHHRLEHGSFVGSEIPQDNESPNITVSHDIPTQHQAVDTNNNGLLPRIVGAVANYLVGNQYSC
ncbi:hypothetical protein BC941DRAFT_67727 [Chlamydoabsidia padenii]|nr:hypothetical protein BC941DRAFT_67727 [Chlamydoabsidia padenii]